MKKLFLLLIVLPMAFSGISQSAKKCLNKGLVKFAQEDYYGAMFDFMKAIDKNPKIAEAYYHMGLTRRALNQGKDPIDPTVSLMQFNPGKTGIGTSKETTVCEVKDYKRIIDSLNEVIKISPNKAILYFDRGAAKGGLKDYAGAIDDYSTALDLNPEYPEAHLFRGRMREALKDYTGAIADFSKAIELSPNSGTAYLARSFAKASIQDSAGASADLMKATEVDPRYEMVTYNVDGSVYIPGHSKEIDAYTKAIALNPKYADAYCDRGLAKIKSKLKDDGCLDLTKAAELGLKRAEEQIRKYCH